MTRRFEWMKAVVVALCVAVLAVATGCDQDLGLEGTDFYCDSHDDCARNFECDFSDGLCVPEGEATNDVVDDTGDAADASDVRQDADDATDVPDPSDTSDVDDAEDSGDDTDASTCQTNAPCPGGVECDESGECVSCTADEQCIGERLCAGDECAACDYLRNERGACEDAEICGLDNTCSRRRCSARDDCPAGTACNIPEEECYRTESWCRDETRCGSGQICNDRGECITPCDSLDDCTRGQICTLRGACELLPPNPSSTCAADGDCSDVTRLCSARIQTPGTCVFWRCDYWGVASGCPDNNFCSRAQDQEENSYNICFQSRCRIGTSGTCGSNEHCVEYIEGYGRCEATGTQTVGSPCSPQSTAESCMPGATCAQLGWQSSPRCQTVCNPFDGSSACGSGERCVVAGTALGVCVPTSSVPTCDATSPEGETCDQAKLCLSDEAGGKSCTDICRVGPTEDDCDNSGICNPARVPGLVGYGVCDSRCSSSSQCGSLETCVIESGSSGFCARSCQSDSDCPLSTMVCKEGHCD